MSVRGGRGQTSSEYLGLLVLVAAIIVAIFALGIGDRIADGIGQAVCRIVSLSDGDGCETGSSDESGPTPREEAESGDYIAIGDSFSSGEGAFDYDPETDTDDNECHRSDNAYPERIADEMDFEGDVHVVTCSGARTHNAGEIEDEDGNPVVPSGQYGEDPQLDAITEADDPSLITIGIGGNDAEWIEVVTTCLEEYNSGCQDDEQTIRANMRQAADDVLAIYRQAAERAPDDARIIGVGYPRFFPDPPTGELFAPELCVSDLNPSPIPLPGDACVKPVGLNPDEQAWMNERFVEFNQMLADRAEQAGIEFVNLYDAFDGHEFGTDDPYMNDLVVDWPDWSECGVPGSLDDLAACAETMVQSETAHPNAAGQAAMAEMVQARIDNP